MGRDGWLRRLGPWVGIGTSPAALMMGGGVGEGLRGAELMAAIVVGVALLAVLAGGQGILGQRTGRPLAALTAGPLGEDGSRRTASVVMLAMMVGWFGVNVGVAGVALARLLGVPDLAGVVLFSAVMLGVVGFGLGVLSWSALVAGLATTGLAVYGLELAFDEREATLSGGLAGSDPIGFLPAVALVIGYGAAFSLRTPDFTHDLARTRQVVWCALAGLAIPTLAFGLAGAAFSLRTPDFTHDLARTRQVVWCALAGLAIPTLAFGLAGAALYAATGTWDLADVLRDLGSPTVAYLFVAVGFTGSVLTNIWSGALSLADAAPRLPHRTALVAVTAAGTVLAAASFEELMLPWLTVMALAAPGLVVVCAIHVARGGEPQRGWGTAGLASWALGFGCGLALHLAGSPLALPAATVVPAVAYWLLGRPGARDLADARLGG